MNPESLKSKKPWLIAAIAIIIVATVAAIFIFKRPAPLYAYTVVKSGSLQADISVSGSVKAAEQVDLAFERSGQLSAINVKVGDQVTSGQVLARLSASDVAAQLEQAQAAYEAQAALLAQLKSGARPDDLNTAQTAVTNATNALSDAKILQSGVQSKAVVDLTNVYGKTGDVLNNAYAQSFDAVNNKINDLFTDTRTNPQFLVATSNQTLQSEVTSQMAALQTELSAWKSSLDALNGVNDQPTLDKSLSDGAAKLNDTVNFLKSVSALLNYAIVTSNYPASALAADKLNLNLALNEVNAALAALNAQTQAISAQKALNTNLLSQAQSQVDQAANSLSSAQSALKLKQSGSDPNQIKAQAAAVASAQANVDDVAAQLSKTVLLSPLTGVVSRQDGQVGEIIAPNQSFISLLSNAKFQVAAQVAEKDLGPLKVGQNASVILDAYGPSRPFAASIIAIDPASTIVNGQSFYKVTLEFATNDEAIKVGMNANVDIITSSLSNALLVPTSSLITSDNGDYVIVDNGTPSGRRQAVSIGLTGSNGLTEVKSGLTAGDKVAIFGSSAPSQN